MRRIIIVSLEMLLQNTSATFWISQGLHRLMFTFRSELHVITQIFLFLRMLLILFSPNQKRSGNNHGLPSMPIKTRRFYKVMAAQG